MAVMAATALPSEPNVALSAGQPAPDTDDDGETRALAKWRRMLAGGAAGWEALRKARPALVKRRVGRVCARMTSAPRSLARSRPHPRLAPVPTEPPDDDRSARAFRTSSAGVCGSCLCRTKRALCARPGSTNASS
jgi:hypothetical protein